jgi:hypothetical protein
MCRAQLAEGSQFCHRCGLPLTGESPRAMKLGRTAMVARVLIVLAWIDCVIGCFLIHNVDIESIVVTGPILAMLGAATIMAGVVASRWRACVIGLAHVALCTFIFLLIVLLDWGPPQAHRPVLLMSAIYTAGSVPASVWAWFEPLRQRSPWFCVQCGYFLRGLIEPRCPECGTPFDPRLLTGYSSNLSDPPRMS